MRAYIIYYIYMLTGLTLVLTACSSQKQAERESRTAETPALQRVEKPNRIVGTSVSALPKAVVYATRKDYSNFVSVTMDARRQNITSFPDPKDIREEQKPVALSGGYWLDQRGVSERTAFLDYTYEQYAALPAPPSLEELKAHILDSDPITVLYTLPLTLSEARSDTARCNAIIASGFEGCKKMKKAPAFQPELKQ